LCFDIGASYGARAEVFLRLGAKVVAFEPQRDCIDEIAARLWPHPRLELVNAAVGSRCGQGKLYIKNHPMISSLVKDWEASALRAIPVPVTTLDDAIEKFGVPDYCRIDVEGYEREVLKGLNQPIAILSFEYRLEGEGMSQALACLDRLASFGELLVNVAPAETPKFAAPTWWTKNAFCDFFRRELPQKPGFKYGEIFVKRGLLQPIGAAAPLAAFLRQSSGTAIGGAR
jgi:FkbM family methyltransferase